MAIQTINVGQIANDGTGDALREAFVKVNDNFEELDLRFPEAATGANLGETGEGIYASATNSVLSFKKIIGGNLVSLSATDSAITINAADSLDQLVLISDSGSIIVARGQTMSLNGGVGLATRVDGRNVVVDATDGILSADGSPTLSANLNANSNNINNAGTVTASQFNGPLDGLVFGVDIRNIAGAYEGFEFGTIRRQYDSAIDFILGEIDVDFGDFSAADRPTVDLGSIIV